MKHRVNRAFWSALGAILTEKPPLPLPDGLSPGMTAMLESPPALPADCLVLPGENLPGRRGRYIYALTWKQLRELGFSRPFRTTLPGGVEILLPFRRNGLAVVPQGFQARVPGELRALALVGKSAALRASGIHLAVCSALYEPGVWSILEGGRCSVCTPDRLVQLVRTLDFSS